MKKSDAQVSQCQFSHVIAPETMQKTVKKVSEPIFSNVKFFSYPYRVPGQEELGELFQIKSFLHVKFWGWKLVPVSRNKFWITSVLWINYQKQKETLGDGIYLGGKHIFQKISLWDKNGFLFNFFFIFSVRWISIYE